MKKTKISFATVAETSQSSATPQFDYSKGKYKSNKVVASNTKSIGKKELSNNREKKESKKSALEDVKSSKDKNTKDPKLFFTNIDKVRLSEYEKLGFMNKWIVCECQASIHPLLTNCTSCGKIMCKVEPQVNSELDRLRFIELFSVNNNASLNSATYYNQLEKISNRAIFCSFCGDLINTILADGVNNDFDFDLDGNLLLEGMTINGEQNKNDNLNIPNESPLLKPSKKSQKGKIVLLSTDGGINNLYPKNTLRSKLLIPRDGPLFGEKSGPDLLDKYHIENDDNDDNGDLMIEKTSKNEQKQQEEIEELKRELPDRSDIKDTNLRKAIEQKDKLLFYQNTSEKRTKVHDLASDFDYQNDINNQWLSKEKRNNALKYQNQLDIQLENQSTLSNQPITFSIDLENNVIVNERYDPNAIKPINKMSL